MAPVENRNIPCMFSTSCLAVIFGTKLLVFPIYTVCLTFDPLLRAMNSNLQTRKLMVFAVAHLGTKIKGDGLSPNSMTKTRNAKIVVLDIKFESQIVDLQRKEGSS